MLQRKVFLCWSLFMSLVLVAMAYGYFLGLYQKVNQLDSSHISFIIIGIFLAASLWSGRLYWQLSQFIMRIGRKNVFKGDAPRVEGFFIDAAHVSFAGEVCQLLGFLGTIHGMLMFIMGPLAGLVNISDIAQLGRMLSDGIPNLGTALVTTYAGIVTSILLGCQNHFFKFILRKLKNGL